MKISLEKEARLSVEQIRDIFSYDADTGIFMRKMATGKLRLAGNTSHKRGYRMIRVNYDRFLAHRLAWLYVHGEWPREEIDHIDGNSDYNAISNLREVSHQENCWNKSIRKDNECGVQHVRKKFKKFVVQIIRGKKRLYHKSFPTLEGAIVARDAETKRLRGEFVPNYNRSISLA